MRGILAFLQTKQKRTAGETRGSPDTRCGSASPSDWAALEGHAQGNMRGQHTLGSIPELLRQRRRHLALGCKRGMDLAGALIGLVALAPLLLLIAVAIRLSDGGPVLFRQERIGYHGRRFRIFKFRSTYRDHCDQSGLTSLEAHDDRLLPLGGFLRQTGLDELPQLLNILLGEMSLVGPRPHVPNMAATDIPYHELVPFYEDRTQMRPGLTGWAQCNGLRGAVCSREQAIARIEHDIAYIQTFSIRLDLKILAHTMACFLVPQLLDAAGIKVSRTPVSVSGQKELLRSELLRTD